MPIALFCYVLSYNSPLQLSPGRSSKGFFIEVFSPFYRVDIQVCLYRKGLSSPFDRVDIKVQGITELFVHDINLN